jgi:hypothetical protein
MEQGIWDTGHPSKMKKTCVISSKMKWIFWPHDLLTAEDRHSQESPAHNDQGESFPHSQRMNPCRSAISRTPVSTKSRDLYIHRNSGINLIRPQGGLEFSTLCSPKLIKSNAELNKGAIDLPIEGIRFCLTQLALGIAQADGDHSLQLPQPQLNVEPEAPPAPPFLQATLC